MNQNYLELTNINKTFKRKTGDYVHSLQNIDLTVQEGEVVAVIGTNGAGKSTLFNALAGLIPVDSGMIHLAGENITNQTQFQLANRVARVFQNPSMGTAPRMTVFENLMLAKKRGQKRGWSISLGAANKRAAGEYLEQFHLDLEKRLDLPIENLSGGQRQTVSLVMATLQKPQLLLLDEHTSALDPRTAKQVMTMTQKMIRDNHQTTLMITHHMQDAINYSDRIIAMHQGRVVRVYEKEEMASLEVGTLYEMMENLVEIEANA